MNSVVENMETLLFEAHNYKGWRWIQEEPLWVTWSMEKFGRSLCTSLENYIKDAQSTLCLVLWCHITDR